MKYGRAILILCGAALLLATITLGAIAWLFRPNMQFIYKDDVVLWNRLRPGRPGVTIIKIDNPADWRLTVRVDGNEMRFDEPLDWSHIRNEATYIGACTESRFPPGTERVVAGGIDFFVHNDSLVHLEINSVHTRDREIQIRTRLSEKWVRFPAFGADDARTLFGEPDRFHDFFMH